MEQSTTQSCKLQALEHAEKYVCRNGWQKIADNIESKRGKFSNYTDLDNSDNVNEQKSCFLWLHRKNNLFV